MVWSGVLQTGFGGPLCAKTRATFWPQSAPGFSQLFAQIFTIWKLRLKDAELAGLLGFFINFTYNFRSELSFRKQEICCLMKLFSEICN